MPNKVLLPIGESSCLVRIIRTAKGSKLANEVIVICPDDNGTITGICRVERVGLSTFKPPDRNVLAEFWHARNWQDTDTVVRLTADCPLLDTQTIDEVIQSHLDSGKDYSYNHFDELEGKITDGDGKDVEVFSGKTLRITYECINYFKEHCTPFMREGRFSTNRVITKGLKDSLSLNNTNDYQKIVEIIKGVHDGSAF